MMLKFPKAQQIPALVIKIFITKSKYIYDFNFLMINISIATENN